MSTDNDDVLDDYTPRPFHDSVFHDWTDEEEPNKEAQDAEPAP